MHVVVRSRYQRVEEAVLDEASARVVVSTSEGKKAWIESPYTPVPSCMTDSLTENAAS